MGNSHIGTTDTSHGAATICVHLAEQLRGDARARRVVTALAQAGYTVRVIDFESEPNQPEHLGEKDGIPVKHIVMPSLFVSARFKPWFLVKLARMIAKGTRQLLAETADAYHANDLKALPAVYLAARLRHKPLIFDSHELPLVEPKLLKWHRLHAIATRVFRILVRGCTEVIVVSPPIAQVIHEQYGVRLPMVLRNVPASASVPRETNQLREALGLERSRRIVLYQGHMHEDRSLDILVRVSKYLAPDVVIVMMGDGPAKAEIQALIRQEEVEDRVKLLPAVPYAELLNWTASADVGVIMYPPSTSLNVRYCLPNKLFEYLMAGIPVLTSNLDAVEEMVHQYEVGQVVASLDPETVASAINTLLADPAALARMRANALAASREALNWEVEQGRLINLYSAILGRPRDATEAHAVFVHGSGTDGNIQGK